jgi:hypothetical protein
LITKQLNEWYQSVNDISGGRLNIIKHAMKRFTVTNAPQAAAALAYYAFFSLFPLLLVAIAGGSYFISTQQIYQNVTQLVHSVIPVSTQLIDENLQEVLSERGTVGILSLLTLLWSASGVFTNLATNINIAWPKAYRRNFLQNRLVGLSIIGGLSVLLILSMTVDWVLKLAPFLEAWTASSLDREAMEADLGPCYLADDFPYFSGFISLDPYLECPLERYDMGRVNCLTRVEGCNGGLYLVPEKRPGTLPGGIRFAWCNCGFIIFDLPRSCNHPIWSTSQRGYRSLGKE